MCWASSSAWSKPRSRLRDGCTGTQVNTSPPRPARRQRSASASASGSRQAPLAAVLERVQGVAYGAAVHRAPLQLEQPRRHRGRHAQWAHRRVPRGGAAAVRRQRSQSSAPSRPQPGQRGGSSRSSSARISAACQAPASDGGASDHAPLGQRLAGSLGRVRRDGLEDDLSPSATPARSSVPAGISTTPSAPRTGITMPRQGGRSARVLTTERRPSSFCLRDEEGVDGEAHEHHVDARWRAGRGPRRWASRRGP